MSSTSEQKNPVHDITPEKAKTYLDSELSKLEKVLSKITEPESSQCSVKSSDFAGTKGFVEMASLHDSIKVISDTMSNKQKLDAYSNIFNSLATLLKADTSTKKEDHLLGIGHTAMGELKSKLGLKVRFFVPATYAMGGSIQGNPIIRYNFLKNHFFFSEEHMQIALATYLGRLTSIVREEQAHNTARTLSPTPPPGDGPSNNRGADAGAGRGEEPPR